MKNMKIAVIGNLNWHSRDGITSNFDQQPIEAMCLIEACIEAFRSTGKMKWIDQGNRCLGWFLGNNDLNEQIYDFKTGGVLRRSSSHRRQRKPGCGIDPFLADLSPQHV